MHRLAGTSWPPNEQDAAFVSNYYPCVQLNAFCNADNVLGTLGP